MSEPSDGISTKTKEIVYMVKELGIVSVMCGALLYVLFWRLDALNKNIERTIYNSRAIMQKLNIPVVLRDEK